MLRQCRGKHLDTKRASYLAHCGQTQRRNLGSAVPRLNPGMSQVPRRNESRVGAFFRCVAV